MPRDAFSSYLNYKYIYTKRAIPLKYKVTKCFKNKITKMTLRCQMSISCIFQNIFDKAKALKAFFKIS